MVIFFCIFALYTAYAPGPHLKLLETLQKPARWDHPTVPPNARSAADATDRTWGDILIEGVGEDSGESEWWVAGVGDGCGEWGVGRLTD